MSSIAHMLILTTFIAATHSDALATMPRALNPQRMSTANASAPSSRSTGLMPAVTLFVGLGAGCVAVVMVHRLTRRREVPPRPTRRRPIEAPAWEESRMSRMFG